MLMSGPKHDFLELGGDEAGAEMGGPSVPQAALSGLLVGLPAVSSRNPLQMRRSRLRSLD